MAALTEFRVQRMVGREAFLDLALRVVVDDQPERVEDGDAARVGFVHDLAHGVLEQHVVDQRIVLRDADALGEQPETFRRVAAPAGADQRRHARIVPAVDVPFVAPAGLACAWTGRRRSG
jgi:hypothetical protein